MRKILVLRGGALGDFLVTLPALRALRERWPQAEIELAGNATAAALAQARGWLTAVHSQHEARWSALFAAGPLPTAFAHWLGEFDLIVNYWPDPDGTLTRHFPRDERQTFLSAPATPTLAPAAAHYCAVLKALGVEPKEFFCALNSLSNEAGRRPAPPPIRRIAVHPGSGSARKNWPRERWQETIAQLPGPVLLILGEAEESTWRDFAERTDERVRVARNLPLETLVAELASCRLFLGHDSGPGHLAAACGVPCMLLFGPTDPAMWAAPAPHVTVVQRGPELTSIALTDVQQAIQTALADPR